ncbi:MAG: DUF4159 domain-containing protein [Planctomycetota bacterium]|jgi:hypothetical protein
MKKRVWIYGLTILTLVSLGGVYAQYRGGYGRYRGDSRSLVPDWEKNADFPDDVFTFVRIEYDSYSGYGGYGRRRRGGGAYTDYPDSDLNFSYRLEQLTSIKADPDGLVLRLTDERLFDYPFIYLIEPGRLEFSDDEVKALRRYLLNGGFLMVDDFWGTDEWNNFYYEFKRVFPEEMYEPQELPLEHPIFHTVFDLAKKPQIPSIGWVRSGTTSERGADSAEVHYRGVFDKNGRMMAIICHNTDVGDGWEREGEDEEYFREFSEKWAFPLGINIVFYAMSH